MEATKKRYRNVELAPLSLESPQSIDSQSHKLEQSTKSHQIITMTNSWNAEKRKIAVLQHMGNITDEAPGPEIGKRRSQVALLKGEISRCERVSSDAKDFLDRIQTEWGGHYGTVMQGDRPLKVWCRHLWKLRGVKTNLLTKETQEGLTNTEIEQLRIADGVTCFCLEHWNNMQRQWRNTNGEEWATPRTLGQWCQDLYKNEKAIASKKKEVSDLEDELRSLGWNPLAGKFLPHTSFFWFRKHKEILGEPLFNFDVIDV